MKDISQDLPRFNRELILSHCTRGILRGGLQDGRIFDRPLNFLTHLSAACPGELHVRSGEIEADANGNYLVVYRLTTKNKAII